MPTLTGNCASHLCVDTWSAQWASAAVQVESLYHQEYKNHGAGMQERGHPILAFSLGFLDEASKTYGLALLLVSFSNFILKAFR